MNKLKQLAACGQSSWPDYLKRSPIDEGELHRLHARFRSRQQHNLREQILSAMRFGFGGHIEGSEAIDPEPKPNASQGHATAQNAAE